MKKGLVALMFSAFFSAAHAGPNINIGTVYDYLDGEKSSYLKRVFNSGDSTAFVRINIFEMTFDEHGEATEVPLSAQGALPALHQGLVASPARLIIPAKGMQSTRLLYLGDRDQERYYRVRFVPVLPEKEDQFAVSQAEAEGYKESLSAGVNIMMGYGAIFFVRPQDSRFDTQLQDGTEEYRVDNKGNSTIELDGFKDCSADNARECYPTRKQVIRPGKSFKFTKVPARQYAFELIEGNSRKDIKVTK